MHVELVHTTTLDQVPLDGYLRMPSGASTGAPLDVIICHHGVGGNFHNPSFFDRVGDGFLKAGSAVLRVNNRGHDDAFLVGDRRFAARTYIDKYGPDARYDYLAHLPKMAKPLLLTVGSLELDNVSFTGLVKDGPTLSGRWPNVDFRLIEGADHAYTNRTDELWSAVDNWLGRLTSVQPTAR